LGLAFWSLNLTLSAPPLASAASAKRRKRKATDDAEFLLKFGRTSAE